MTKKYSDIKRKKIRNEKVEKERKFKTEDENRDQGQKVWEGLQMRLIQRQKIYIIRVSLNCLDLFDFRWFNIPLLR